MYGHAEYHRRRDEAMAAHRQRLLDAGLIGEVKKVNCVQSPMDEATLQRIGPKECEATFIRLGVSQHGDERVVALDAKTARRLAGMLLELADEAEPYRKGTAPDDLIAGEAR